MEIASQRRLPIDRESVWRALNDPQILKAAIPGCQSIEREADNEYALVVAAALGPVRATFRGRLRVEDMVAPERYTLRFEGQGGAAGFAKGAAKVELTEEAGETLLSYQVSAQVGGRIAQVGSRLIDSAAMKLADDFFAAFASQVAPAATSIKSEPKKQGIPPVGLVSLAIGALVVLVLILVLR